MAQLNKKIMAVAVTVVFCLLAAFWPHERETDVLKIEQQAVTASEKAILASFFLDDVRRHFYTYHQQEACEGEHYCSSDVRVDLPCVHLHDSIGAGCVHEGGSFRELGGYYVRHVAPWPDFHQGADDEARKAILDLREKVEAAQNAQLMLQNQIEALREQNARLIGRVEELSNQLTLEQRSNRDLYTDLDKRMAELEPADVELDGRTVRVSAEERRLYTLAVSSFSAISLRDATWAKWSTSLRLV